MGMVFKKPKLNMPGGGSTSGQSSLGICCSLYPAAKAAPSNTEIEGFKAYLQMLNKNFGLSLYMILRVKMYPPKLDLPLWDDISAINWHPQKETSKLHAMLTFPSNVRMTVFL